MNHEIHKVALYQPYPHTLGGLQAVVLQLGKGLRQQGWEPLIICPEEGKFAGVARKTALPVLICDPGAAWHLYGRGDKTLSYLFAPGRVWSLLRYWVKLSRDLQKQGVTVLHCNDYRGVILAAPAARLAGIPVVWHMHGYIPSRLANVVSATLVHRVAAVSRGMLDYFRLPGFLTKKFGVIHNGLEEVPPFSSAASEPPIVLAVGTLHPRKGYETLLRAFREVAARIPNAECHILGGEFGDGSHARDLRALAAREGIADRIHFRGYSGEVAAEMARCAILAIPSRVEAFGMVAIEAMAAGKPVVATRTGGLKDIVEHGETGFLVEEDDAEGMARYLIDLLQDRTQAEKMGRAGRERVNREFTSDRMIAAFAQLYRTLSHPPAEFPAPISAVNVLG